MLFRLPLFAAVLLLAACESSPDVDVSDTRTDDGVSEAGTMTDAPPIAEVAPTPGAETGTVQPTSTVRFDYAGTLADGTEFDSGSNVTFQLTDMIPGFRNGMTGMAPGETKIFDVQPEDGYGDNPPPGIPVGAVMTFEVTVHEII